MTCPGRGGWRPAMLRLVAEWLKTEWQNPSWDWPLTHTANTHTLTHTHTHTQSPLSVPAGERTQPLGQGPGARGGIQRAVEVSPQFQIHPAVKYWHGKIQPCDSTPSAAFKPNSSTSSCVCACAGVREIPLTLTLLHSCWTREEESRSTREKERDRERMEAREEKAWMWSQGAKWMTHWHPLGWTQESCLFRTMLGKKKVSFHYIYCHIYHSVLCTRLPC